MNLSQTTVAVNPDLFAIDLMAQAYDWGHEDATDGPRPTGQRLLCPRLSGVAAVQPWLCRRLHRPERADRQRALLLVTGGAAWLVATTMS